MANAKIYNIDVEFGLVKMQVENVLCFMIIRKCFVLYLILNNAYQLLQ